MNFDRTEMCRAFRASAKDVRRIRFQTPAHGLARWMARRSCMQPEMRRIENNILFSRARQAFAVFSVWPVPRAWGLCNQSVHHRQPRTLPGG